MRTGQLRVLSPCQENYDRMEGTGATRFCDKCEKNVTNLSRMTRPEADAFMDAAAGTSVCVRYSVGRDGLIDFRPSVSTKVAFVAVLSLAMAACTGFVDADELDVPDDALVCRDGTGYVIPCDEVDAGSVPDTHPGGDDGASGDGGNVSDGGAVASDGGAIEEAEVIMGEMPIAEGEGCPVQPHGDIPRDRPLMGRMLMPSKRELRRMRREDRRIARRDRRR